jgi:hypothetical protein
MAVVQISRIQIRRGKINSGTGLPQLASGELAWAVDTQELYIGNGAVSEGSPAVGNTKILTLNDLTAQGSILSLLEYDYKSDDTSITTGVNQTTPTTRILQYKLDDIVNVRDFGAVGDGLQDDTIALQRAINQLFLNTAKASSFSELRVSLIMPAGTFKTTNTLYIPSYATIIGAGADKSIISYEPTVFGTSPAIQFINDLSTIGNPSNILTTLFNNQPRNIIMSGLTVLTKTGRDVAMQMDCVRDSVFSDINLRGNAGLGTGLNPIVNYTASSVGLQMNALTSAITTENNIFTNFKFYNFNQAVNAKFDISSNHFNNGYVEECFQGFVLGDNANGTTPGQQVGPRETTISEYKFYRIMRHAVYLELGSNNSTNTCVYTNVGNVGANNAGAIYPQVYYATPGNTSIGDKSDRPTDLSTSNLLTLYSPEFAGRGIYKPNLHLGQINLSGSTGANNYSLAFRLPCNTNSGGVPEGSVTYSIEYRFENNAGSGAAFQFSRRGVITVSARIIVSASVLSVIQLSDDFDFAGPANDAALQTSLDFKAVFLDQSNAICTSPSQTPASIGIYYTNPYGGASGQLYYTYSASL